MKIESAKDFIKRKERQFQNDKEKQKSIGMKDIGRKGRFYFLREAWTFLSQYDMTEKVFVLERLVRHITKGKIVNKKNWKPGETVYRIGYFIVGRIGRGNGRWMWGQFCPLVPQKDLMKLINKAKKEKTII